MKLPILSVAAMAAGWSLGAAEKPATVDIIEMKDFTTSVKRQLEKKKVLKAYEASQTVAVQLVWSDQDAAPKGQILEERIKPRSTVLELNSTQRTLLLKALSEDSDYEESLASCMCEFQPQLRVVFHSELPEARYDILLSGISHGEVQAFRNGHLEAYARTSQFVPAFLSFLAATFPEHELTTMLQGFQKTRQEANQRPSQGR